MFPEIVVERFVSAVKKLDLVKFLEASNEDGHLASHRPDEGFGRLFRLP